MQSDTEGEIEMQSAIITNLKRKTATRTSPPKPQMPPSTGAQTTRIHRREIYRFASNHDRLKTRACVPSNLIFFGWRYQKRGSFQHNLIFFV